MHQLPPARVLSGLLIAPRQVSLPLRPSLNGGFICVFTSDHVIQASGLFFICFNQLLQALNSHIQGWMLCFSFLIYFFLLSIKISLPASGDGIVHCSQSFGF